MTFVERTKCQRCLQLQSSSRSPCGTRQFPAVSTSKCIRKVEERNLLTNLSILETKIPVIRAFRLQHCFALHFTLCGSESELGRGHLQKDILFIYFLVLKFPFKMPWNDSFHRLHSIFLGSRAGGTANALLKASRFVCSTASTLQYQLAQSRVLWHFEFWLWVKTLISVEPDRSGRHSMSTVALAAGAPPQKHQGVPWK